MKLNRIAAIFILLCSFLLADMCASAASFDTTYARILQNRIEYLKNAYGLVGISAAVDAPRQGQWLGAAGISETGVNLDPGMVFDVGSTTKNFMAALTLQLAEADSLNLDDSIGTWLPHYNNINNKITIRQLLNHTSGIYNFTDNAAWGNAINGDLTRLWALEEVVSGYVLTPYFLPGAGWHYSNTNYVLLAIIIKQITKSDLSPLFHSRFYGPLGMTESFIELEDTLTVPFVHNWVLSNGVLVDAYGTPRTAFTSSTMGAGGVLTRPENMIRWMKGLYNGNILQHSSLGEMLTFVNASISGANGYGLGTMRYSVNGKICWGHAGNSFGHSSVSMYYAVDSIYISLMTNKDINTGPLGVDFMNTAISNNPIGLAPYSNNIPKKFELKQNYPNPFNPVTQIKFSVPKSSLIKIAIYDIAGKEISVLVNENLAAGEYKTNWDASAFASGIYFYRIEAADFSETRKMSLVK